MDVFVAPVAGLVSTGVEESTVAPDEVTLTLPVAVQPLEPVPVTEYVPAADTLRVAKVLLLSQR